MSDKAIEQEIQAKGLTAPRVTPQRIHDVITGVYYFTAANGIDGLLGAQMGCGVDFPDREALRLLTFCVLVLKNGFTVTGESACASPENFNSEIGRRIARENAISKVWPLLGYALKEKLACASESC